LALLIQPPTFPTILFPALYREVAVDFTAEATVETHFVTVFATETAVLATAETHFETVLVTALQTDLTPFHSEDQKPINESY
jgi:hypothetical protein